MCGPPPTLDGRANIPDWTKKEEERKVSVGADRMIKDSGEGWWWSTAVRTDHRGGGGGSYTVYWDYRQKTEKIEEKRQPLFPLIAP